MQSNKDRIPDSEELNDQISKAMGMRILQSALFHRVNGGVDPIIAHRFATTGVLGDVEPPKVAQGIREILKDLNHPDRVEGPIGPNLFFKESAGVTAIDVDTMLLHPDNEIRCTAFEFFKSGISNKWVSRLSADLIQAKENEIQSPDKSKWRPAGIEIVESLRVDLYLHLAGLRQSIAHHFQEGVNKHLTFLMRPPLTALQYLRPPIYCPSEQRTELADLIENCASNPNLEAALSDYLDNCGYLPICSEFSASRMVEEWESKNGAQKSLWEKIQSWTQTNNSPTAKFHAILIALNNQAAMPDNIELFWENVLRVLNLRETQNFTDSPSWQLYSELASHYCRHIESLHPGQDGERVSSYAWWLTDLVGQALATSETQAEMMLHRVVQPEAQISFSKWLISRSHVIPSSLRFGTLYLSSVWAISLLTQLSFSKNQHLLKNAKADKKEKIKEILKGYLITSPIAETPKVDAIVFAFQENEKLDHLLDALMDTEELDTFRKLVSIRQELQDPVELTKSLERVLDKDYVEQLLTMLVLKGSICSSDDAESAFRMWIEEQDGFIECLKNLPSQVVEHLLEALADFYVRQDANLTVRIPHLLVRAIESLEDEDRAKRLFLSVFFMSFSGGIVSPIQRALNSKWRSALVEVAKTSREKAVHVKIFAEPWVSGRIRSTSAAISRLIGPREYVSDEELENGLTGETSSSK